MIIDVPQQMMTNWFTLIFFKKQNMYTNEDGEAFVLTAEAITIVTPDIMRSRSVALVNCNLYESPTEITFQSLPENGLESNLAQLDIVEKTNSEEKHLDADEFSDEQSPNVQWRIEVFCTAIDSSMNASL